MYWATRISMLGMEMALLPLGGYWLDRQFGTAPVLVIVGACLGILIASLDFYQLTKTRFGSSRKRDGSADRRPGTDE
jgi:F0F1-type ATP synthase assembly protein I